MRLIINIESGTAMRVVGKLVPVPPGSLEEDPALRHIIKKTPCNQ